MERKRGGLDRLIGDLCRQYGCWLRSLGLGGELRDLHEMVARTYPPVSEGSLARFLEGIHSGVESSLYLFLKPPQGLKVLPVVSLAGDAEQGQLRVRVALFTFSEARILAGIGFRFEPSEGASSLHDYHHVQLIRSFEKGGTEFPQAPKWLPIGQPAIPISAKNSAMLFVNLLVSLYGMKSVAEFRDAGSYFDLAGELRSLQEGCRRPSVAV
jgi:hypothetical protein